MLKTSLDTNTNADPLALQASTDFSTGHAPWVADTINIAGFTNKTLALTNAAGAMTLGDGAGLYDLHSNVDCYIRVSATGLSVTVANGYKLMAGNMLANVVVPPGYTIGAVVASGVGTLNAHRVK